MRYSSVQQLVNLSIAIQQIFLAQLKSDSNLTLLKLTTPTGEYWDRSGGKLMHLFEIVKGALTGETDKSGRDEKLGDEPL